MVIVHIIHQHLHCTVFTETLQVNLDVFDSRAMYYIAVTDWT